MMEGMTRDMMQGMSVRATLRIKGLVAGAGLMLAGLLVPMFAQSTVPAKGSPADSAKPARQAKPKKPGATAKPDAAAEKPQKHKPRVSHARRPVKAAVLPERNLPAAGYDKRPEVRAFVDDLAARHQLPTGELLHTLREARNLPVVARLMVPATSSQPPAWSAYRGRFVEPLRIAAGVRFWTENAATLARATREYGVPEEIIVGITGVETIYGRNTGTYRVLDALSTLAFDYPKEAPRDRSPFFRAQLEDYLLFVHEQRLDPLAVRGSYAGAIGIPQFMPGSYRRFAVDFDGDGAIDLSANPADVIGSVANFLKEHGWAPGAPIFHRIAIPTGIKAEDLRRLVDAGAEPTITGAQLRKLSFELDPALADDEKFALINLPDPVAAAEAAAPDAAIVSTVYVLGTRNFTTLTRYNRSYFYAMAVAELGAAVRAALPAGVTR